MDCITAWDNSPYNEYLLVDVEVHATEITYRRWVIINSDEESEEGDHNYLKNDHHYRYRVPINALVFVELVP